MNTADGACSLGLYPKKDEIMREETAAHAKNKGRTAYLFQGSNLAEKYARDGNHVIAKYHENGQYLEEINACWDEGWKEAEQEEREHGRVGLLLRELAERLTTIDEWYGSDFEEPLYLATEALNVYEKQRQADVTKS